MRSTYIKKACILFVLLVILGSLWGQKNNSVAEVNNTPTPKVTDLPATTILNIEYLTISARALGGNNYEFTINNNKDKQNIAKKTFTLQPLTQKSFYASFKFNFIESIKDLSDPRLTSYQGSEFKREYNLFEIIKIIPSNKLERDFTTEVDRIFNHFISSIRTVDFLSVAPVAGDLCFEPRTTIQQSKLNVFVSKQQVKDEFNSIKSTLRRINGKLVYTGTDDNSYKGKKQIKNRLHKELLAAEQVQKQRNLSDWQYALDTLNRSKVDSLAQKETLTNSLNNAQVSHQEITDSITGLKTDTASLNQEINAFVSFFENNNLFNTLNVTRANQLTEQIISNAIANLPNTYRNIEQTYQRDFLQLNQEEQEKGSAIRQAKINIALARQQLRVSQLQRANDIRVSDSILLAIQSGIPVSQQEQTDRQALVNSLSANISRHNASIGDYQTIINTEENKIKTENIIFNQKKAQLEKQKQRLQNFQKEEAALHNLLARFNFNNEKRSELRSKEIDIQNLSQQRNAIATQITTRQNNLSRLNSQLTQINSNILLAEQNTTAAQNELIDQPFEIDYAEVEFNNGFIENIEVYGHILDQDGNPTGDQIKLENLSPIGFSRKIDYDYLKGKKLYSQSVIGGRPGFSIYITDFLKIYRLKLAVNRRDYSPANQVLILDKEDCYTLKKDATYKLFAINAFSDFAGLKSGEPNGLIQLEFDRRISLITDRRIGVFFLSKRQVYSEINWGYLQYIEPSAVVAKFEETERYLPLERRNRIVNGQYRPIRYQSITNLKQYQVFEIGFDLNLFLLDAPSWKSTLYFDAGFRYGITPIRDTIYNFDQGVITKTDNAEEQLINTWEVYPKITWEVKADERLRFMTSYQPTWLFARTNEFQQVQSLEDFAFDGSGAEESSPFHRIEILGFYDPPATGNGRIFVRYRWNWQQGYWKTGFRQLQIGYSFYLLGVGKDTQN